MIFQSKAEFLSAINKERYTLIAIDIGQRKCGIASWSSDLSFAVPLKTVSTSQLFHEIQALRPDGIIIGVSKPDDKQLASINAFIAKLGIPGILQDESYSTAIADQLLRDTGLNRKTRNQIDDKLSAKLILDWFIARAQD